MARAGARLRDVEYALKWRVVGIATWLPRESFDLPRAVELTLFGDAFKRLARVLDAVLIIVAIGRQQFDHFVASAGGGPPNGARGEVDGLSHLKPVIIPHATLPIPNNAPPFFNRTSFR
jgi:hypothetical protein